MLDLPKLKANGYLSKSVAAVLADFSLWGSGLSFPALFHTYLCSLVSLNLWQLGTQLSSGGLPCKHDVQYQKSEARREGEVQPGMLCTGTHVQPQCSLLTSSSHLTPT